MSVLEFVLVALAGGLGAVARFLLDGAIRGRVRTAMPWGTVTINLTGSLLLGLLTGLSIGGLLPGSVQLIAGTGFLGGYTTFSTASYETVRLLQEGRWVLGLLNGFGVALLATAAALLGLMLTGAL